MMTGTVEYLTNQIKNKTSEIQELKRDLRKLNQSLIREVERVEWNKEEASRGKLITWEEIEWDIHVTKSAIKGITKEVDSIKDRLYKLIKVKSTRRIASE